MQGWLICDRGPTERRRDGTFDGPPQAVRRYTCNPGRSGVSPSHDRFGDAALAQPVEHIIRNDGVACSSHASGTNKIKHLAIDRSVCGVAGVTQGSRDADSRVRAAHPAAPPEEHGRLGGQCDQPGNDPRSDDPTPDAPSHLGLGCYRFVVPRRHFSIGGRGSLRSRVSAATASGSAPRLFASDGGKSTHRHGTQSHPGLDPVFHHKSGDRNTKNQSRDAARKLVACSLLGCMRASLAARHWKPSVVRRGIPWT